MLLLALALLLAACGGGEDADTGSAEDSGGDEAATATDDAGADDAAEDDEEAAAGDEGEDAAAEDLGAVRLVFAGGQDFSTTDLAYWEQLMTEAGIEVDAEFVDAADAALRTVVAGAADGYVGSLPSAILAVANSDAPIKVVAVNQQASSYALVAQSSVESIEDLATAQIGINTLGSAGHTVVEVSLQEAGIDTSGVQWVTIGGTSARVAALLSGQIEAGPAHFASAVSAVEQDEDLHVLFSASEGLGAYLQSGLMLSDEWAEANPETAQVVVDTLVQAQRWAQENEAEYIELSTSQDGELSDDVRDQAYDLYADIGFFAINGGLSEERIDHFLELIDATGELGLSLDELPDREEWLDMSYVEDFVEREGCVAGPLDEC